MLRLVGWKELAVPLSVLERARDIIHRYVQRIEQLAGEPVEASVHVKHASKTGVAHRYEIYASAQVGNRLFYSRVMDWDLVSATHRAFASIERQADSKYGREHVYDKTMFFAEPPLKL